MSTLRALVPAVALALTPFAARAQADSAPAALDRIFARFASRESPGCALGVARDGRVVLERAYGTADLEHDVANAPTTIFEAGSVSKQFTAAAIVLLAQQGRLSLDDDVRKHVPELPDYGQRVRLRHMLNHTSGFRDWGVIAALEGWPRGSRTHTHTHVLDIVQRQRALNFPPGSQYLYSNTNYNLLAIIVDRVSGMPFAEFTRRSIFEPLGMRSTQWRDDYTRIVKGRAAAYEREGDTLRLSMPFENVHGNGGLLTTVGDLLRWNANFDSARVGGRALVEELQRRGRLNNGREIAYAAGLFVRTYRGAPEVAHDGATAGYRAYLARYPAQRLSVALLCNTGEAGQSLARQVVDAFLGDLPRPQVARPAGIPMPAGVLAMRAGLYRNTRTNEPLRLVLRDGKLALGRGPEFVPLSRALYQLAGTEERGVFEDGDDGRPTRLLRLLADGDTIVYEPVPEARPSPEVFAQYAGEYWSDEVPALYAVSAEHGKLMVRDRVGTGTELTPEYADAFNSRMGVVRFSRDAGGRIDGMSLWLGRVRGIRFRKVGAGDCLVRP